MSTTSTRNDTIPASNPFTATLVRAIEKLYPRELADSSFDNTGLLLEAPWDPCNRPPQKSEFRKGDVKVVQARSNKVLLCIDLTTAVANEAVGKGAAVVVAYHPIIFRPLKSITSENTQQRSLLELAANGISVYSPHTAVDAAIGGNADWLADIITMSESDFASAPPYKGSHSGLTNYGPYGESRERLRHEVHNFPKHGMPLNHPCESHFRSPITPSEHSSETGFGRLVRLESQKELPTILMKLGKGLGNPGAFSVALPQGVRAENMGIRTIGICAGSGGSVLSKSTEKLDMLVTGEMSHHETLAAIEQGQVVVCLGHSNSERGYLGAVMKSSLKAALDSEWERARADMVNSTWFPKINEEWQELLANDDTHVEVSERDEDPFKTLILQRDQQ
ncbi:MAG: hypothetical protein M1831_006369 [Alyxoria varia]|nr:MAG: hypothetical protein M1831_006369 [Alyxoria varia]